MLIMSDLDFSQTSVASLLKASPKAIHFFLEWKTACAGCGFARFCTLKDVIGAYHFDEKAFLEAAEKLIAQKSLSRRTE